MPDTLSPYSLSGEPRHWPDLEERFLPPPDFVWGRFTTSDGAVLRWGYLPVPRARAQCVLVGGFGEFIEKQFETIRDLAARKIEVWCLDWRGQGGSTRPTRLPHRPRARNFDSDAADLAAFAADKLTAALPRLLIAHSMGGAIALLCLQKHPRLFAAAVLSSPMLGFRIAGLPPTLIRCITAPARAAGLDASLIPGVGRWQSKRCSPAATDLSSNQQRYLARDAWLRANPSLRVDAPTYGWLDSALALVGHLQKPEFLRDIRTPILMGSPEYEFVVSPAAQRRAATLLPMCTLVELAGSKHDPFLERDAVRETWLRQVEGFIAEQFGAQPLVGAPAARRPRSRSLSRKAA